MPAANLETRVADLLTVLDTVRSERRVLAGLFEEGTPNMLLAATHPERVHSLVWDHPQARSVRAEDYPWGVGPEFVEAERSSFEHWGTIGYAKAWAAMVAADGRDASSDESVSGARHIAKLSRHTATPDVSRELSQIWHETDVRAILGSVRAPSLLLTEPDPSYIEEATYVASLLPDARVEVHNLFAEPGQAAELIRRFTGAEPSAVSMDTVLATVLFTDIVGSTEKQSSLGDRGWKDLVGRHHAIVRESLARWHGVENDTAGDGFYATFDGPARAIRCALEIAEHVRDLGSRSGPASIPASARSSRVRARDRGLDRWARGVERRPVRGAHHPDCEGPRCWERPRFPGGRRVRTERRPRPAGTSTGS